MVLETERLELIPLDTGLVRLWVEDVPALETVLDCKYVLWRSAKIRVVEKHLN